MENNTTSAFRSSKNTSILWAIILTVCTLGCWPIYLTFRWTENLNYLKRLDDYNPWALSSIAAGGLILVIITSFFTSGSWFLDLLSLVLSNGLFLFLIIQIKAVGDKQNSGNETRKNVFGWLVAAFVIDTLYCLGTIGHHDCKCFLCSNSIWLYSIISIVELCLLAWLFNQALDYEKGNNGDRVNEGNTNGAWIFGIVSSLAVVIFLVIALASGANDMTVAEFREAAEQEINKALSTSDHDLRRYVENAHKTVTVHTAYVSDMQITTKDGSNNAGAEGNNIRRIHLEITTRWDGMIHKNGHTVVGIDIESINGEAKVTSAGIIRTDAMVNTEDPKFWYEVGAAAALLLL